MRGSAGGGGGRGVVSAYARAFGCVSVRGWEGGMDLSSAEEKPENWSH